MAAHDQNHERGFSIGDNGDRRLRRRRSGAAAEEEEENSSGEAAYEDAIRFLIIGSALVVCLFSGAVAYVRSPAKTTGWARKATAELSPTSSTLDWTKSRPQHSRLVSEDRLPFYAKTVFDPDAKVRTRNILHTPTWDKICNDLADSP